MPNLGAHMSVAGGLHNAFDQAKEAGAQIMQIFSKNSNQWKAKPLGKSDIHGWLDGWQASDVWEVTVHDSYLINLGSPEPPKWAMSKDAFKKELLRCEQLRIPYLVMHPGAHMGEGEDFAIHRIAAAFNEICAELNACPTTILIENTAGQGSNVGYRFEHIAGILNLLDEPDRFGVCFDTCHALAGGYDFRTKQGYAAMMQQFDDLIGVEKIRCFHMNDSKKDCCSRVDRHEHIGQGFVGLDAFRFLVNDERFFKVPMCLETPKAGEAPNMDLVNLQALRELRTKKTQTAVKKAVTEAKGAAESQHQRIDGIAAGREELVGTV